MNTFAKAFYNAFSRMREKDWDRIYVLVDVHGVIMEPNYDGLSNQIYPQCIAPLQRMTADPRIKLIMWTCSHPDDIVKYQDIFEKLDIVFDYVNANPEVDHCEAIGDYRDKLYANVILDDKGGFEPVDWESIERWYNMELELHPLK